MTDILSGGIQLVYFLIKLTALALALFWLGRYFFRLYFGLNQSSNLRSARQQQSPLKLQAYERLALFCERISIPQLIFRLNSPGITAQDLGAAIFISIQKEFEHNMSQQIYVSHKLWQIIRLAKDDVTHIVNQAMQSVGEQGTGDQLIQKLFELDPLPDKNPLYKALAAINQEVQLYV